AIRAVEHVAVAQGTGAMQPGGDAARTIAALAGFAAILVDDAVTGDAAGLPRRGDDHHLVATDAEVAVGHARQHLTGRQGRSIAPVEHDEIVAGPVHLGEAQGLLLSRGRGGACACAALPAAGSWPLPGRRLPSLPPARPASSAAARPDRAGTVLPCCHRRPGWRGKSRQAGPGAWRYPGSTTGREYTQAMLPGTVGLSGGLVAIAIVL